LSKKRGSDLMSITTACPSTSSRGFTSEDLGSFRSAGSVGSDDGSKSGDDECGPQPVAPRDDGMESHASSKTSKARSSKDRGPARKAKAKARLLAHLSKEGKDYDPHRRFKNASASMNEEQGIVATSLQNEMIEELPEETVREKGTKIAELVLPENSVFAIVPKNPQRWVSIINGEPYCHLCKKAGQPHLTSKLHRLRQEEDALSTLMAGISVYARRFDGAGIGYVGPATKKAISDYFGDGLTSLPAEAAKLHASKSMWLDNKVEIKPSDVRGYELGIVRYSGSGKYGSELTINHFLPFDRLPDSDEVITEDTPAPSPPPGEGWWPVISMRLSDEGLARITKVKRGGILIICFYQLMEATLICWQMVIDDDGFVGLPRIMDNE
jgi:hypothetical protein